MINKISAMDLVLPISETLDLVSNALKGHHLRTTYFSVNIGKEMNLTNQQMKNLIIASLVHDIGAISEKGRLELLNFDIKDPHKHAYIGSTLLSTSKRLEQVSHIIKNHHMRWDNKKLKKDDNVKIESYILHLADRIDVIMNDKYDVNKKIKNIVDTINKESNKKFHPDVVKAFNRLAPNPCFWLEIDEIAKVCFYKYQMYFYDEDLSTDDYEEIIKIIGRIIDFRSRFTASHSSGVANVAENISTILNLDDSIISDLKIAAYLHDIGKLTVPNQILEKKGKLNDYEYSVMKKHPYHTYLMLRKIKGFEQISEWAAFHHEKINGEGYPFKLKGDYLSLESRIISISDIFTALTENRPYRKGLSKQKVLKILNEISNQKHIDKELVYVLSDNYNYIYENRAFQQKKAIDYYDSFWKKINYSSMTNY